MKKKTSLILATALALSCIFSVSAFAANETGGNVDVTMTIPFSNGTGDTGDTGDTGGDSGGSTSTENDDTPSYSYIVNIPTKFAVTINNDRFGISASKMDIPDNKEVVVRLNSVATFEPDGNFYLYRNGDRSGEEFLQCYITRILKDQSDSERLRGPDVLASFRNGELAPKDWAIVMVNYDYDGYLQAAEGTYSGTIYYNIGLE